MRALALDNIATRKNDNWGTPRALAVRIVREFQCEWDLAADQTMSVCGPRYFGPESSAGPDALAADWLFYARSGYLNPPFSLLKPFVAKAVAALEQGYRTVALLPVKTETVWWQTYVPRASEVRFLRGRVPYIDPETGRADAPARFASALVVWDGWQVAGWQAPTRYGYWAWKE